MKRLIIIALLLAACTVPQNQILGHVNAPETTSFSPDSIKTESFASEQELTAFLKDNTGSSYDYYGRGVMMADAGSMVKSVSAPEAMPIMAGGTPDFSNTNNQVAAVDEADSTKNDGEFVYTITGQSVFIVKAYPGEDAQVVSTIDYEKETPSALFVKGDRLAVFGNFYDNEYFRVHNILPYTSMTFLRVYDITDRAHPKEIENDKFEGYYVDGRLMGDNMYLVLSSPANSDQPLPLAVRNDVVEKMEVSRIRYFPYPYNSVEYAIVRSIDILNPSFQDSLAVLVESNPSVYMSEDNIYLASNEYINEYQISQDVTIDIVKLTSDEQALVDRINAVDSDILPKNEKKQKIIDVYSRHVQYLSESEQKIIQDNVEAETARRMKKYESSSYTAITKIRARDLSLQATASIAGSVNNQFSLDEHDNVLRVATTLSPFYNYWARPMMDSPMMGIATTDASEPADVAQKVAPESILPREPSQIQTTNRVYTLDSNLEVLDVYKDIAPGENIYSARFIDARLYLVTFRQVDPFYVFDLSEPTNIKELGSLKVPGFSRYLHPYDENIVIGIGRDASALGRQEGLKISLFDVSDVSKPKEIAKWVATDDYSSSTAEYEHKAFLFDREKSLLVIPAYSYSWDNQGSHQNYNGAMVFKVTKSDIEMRGIIDHTTGAQQYWQPQVERSLWIGDLLYTKSATLLRINKIDDLSSVKNVTLSSSKTGPYPIY